MVIGIPCEMMDHETRVAMGPSWAGKLVNQGHRILVQTGAGAAGGYPDKVYTACGAEITATMEEVYEKSDMVLKVKDLVDEDLKMPFREGQLIMTFFHMGESLIYEKAVKRVLESKIIASSLELFQEDDGTRPIIRTMSYITGQMSVLLAAQYGQVLYGGKGICLAPPEGAGLLPKILILGGGNCGSAAALLAKNMGLDVVVLESLADKIEKLQDRLPGCRIRAWSTEIFEEEIADSDVLINTIYPWPGMEKPLIRKESIAKMPAGGVLVDLPISGIIETSKLTTHSRPTYVREGIVHYCVGNIPALVPQTSINVLSAAIFPYVEAIANKGLREACIEHKQLARSMSFIRGTVVHPDIAETQGIPYTPFSVDML